MHSAVAIAAYWLDIATLHGQRVTVHHLIFPVLLIPR